MSSPVYPLYSLLTIIIFEFAACVLDLVGPSQYGWVTGKCGHCMDSQDTRETMVTRIRDHGDLY